MGLRSTWTLGLASGSTAHLAAGSAPLRPSLPSCIQPPASPAPGHPPPPATPSLLLQDIPHPQPPPLPSSPTPLSCLRAPLQQLAPLLQLRARVAPAVSKAPDPEGQLQPPEGQRGCLAASASPSPAGPLTVWPWVPGHLCSPGAWGLFPPELLPPPCCCPGWLPLWLIRALPQPPLVTPLALDQHPRLYQHHPRTSSAVPPLSTTRSIPLAG